MVDFVRDEDEDEDWDCADPQYDAMFADMVAKGIIAERTDPDTGEKTYCITAKGRTLVENNPGMFHFL